MDTKQDKSAMGCVNCGADDHDTKDCTRLPAAADGLEVVVRIDKFGNYKHGSQAADEDTELCRLTDAQRLLSQLREDLAQRDAEVERLKSAAPVVSDVVHHTFSRDRDIGWNAPAAEQALRVLFEDWLKRSQFTRPNSPWDIWKACAKALESQQAASVGGERDAKALAWMNTRTGETTSHQVQVYDWDDEGEPVESLMTIAQHERIVAALSPAADQCRLDVARALDLTGDHEWPSLLAAIKTAAKLAQDEALSPAGGGVVPEGYALVPVIPTADMREAFHVAQEQWEDGGYDSPDHQWAAMLDAVAQPQANSQEAEGK